MTISIAQLISIFFISRWRGSVYKLVWRELLAYLALYYTINVMYRYVLTDDQKRYVGFESIFSIFACIRINDILYLCGIFRRLARIDQLIL